MKTILLSLMTAIISITPGFCGVERVSIDQNGQAIVFYSPIVSTPAGFSIDQGESLKQHKRVFVQTGSSISSSKTRLFSEAVLKSEIPNIYSIDHFISERLKGLKASDPSISSVTLQGLNTGDGIPIKSVSIDSQVNDDLIIATYQEDGKYYVVIEAAFKKNTDSVAGFQAFLALLNSYHPESVHFCATKCA